MKLFERFKWLWRLYSEYTDAGDIHDFVSSEYSADCVRATAKSFNDKKFFWMPSLKERC